MRKILLGTSAVVGAALLAPAAFAQAPVTTAPGGAQSGLRGDTSGTTGVTMPAPAIATPGGLSVRLGGFFDFRAGMIQDDWDRARSRISSSSNGGGNQAQGRSRYDFQNDSELHVFVDGRAANGMTYGAVMEFQMDGVGGQTNTVVDLDEAYMFLSLPSLGRLTFGQDDNAASQLMVRAPGVGELADGNWSDFIVNAGLYSSPYMLAGINDGNDATKIIYTSPQFFGFDFGLSYAPQTSGEGRRIDQTGTLGGSTTNYGRDRVIGENEISAAARYRGTFGPVGVNAGFGWMRVDPAKLQSNGNAIAVQQQEINAYTVGLALSAYGFAFGGEYTWGAWNGSSPGRSALNAGLDDSYLFTIGATYTFGPLLVGANYGMAKQDNGTTAAGVSLSDRTHTYWGVGATYNLAPGLAAYVIYNHINDENIPTGGPRDAAYGGGGTSLASFNGSNTRTISMGLAGIRMAF